MPDFSSGSDLVVFGVVVLVRLVVPLFIPRFPLPAILAALVADAVDHSVFQALTDLDLGAYQIYDKGLDVYYLTVAYISTIRNWGGGHAFVVGRFLWYWRLVGVALFEYTEARWLLVVFPNTFEYFFIAIEGLKVARNPFVLTNRQITAIAAGIWVVVKIPQEVWIHVAQLDVTDVLKERVFGAEPDATWASTVAGRPLAGLLLVAGLGAVVLCLRWATRFLPPPAFASTFDADVQGKHFGWRPPGPRVRPRAVFGWPFVEKVALVSLVTLIFLRMVPSADRSVLGVITGTAAVMGVSTVRNRWLADRSVLWRSVVVQFVAMYVLDIALVLVWRELLPMPNGRTPVGSTLFLTSLLTLIVVMFDRFQAIAHQHSRARREARLVRTAARLGAP